MKRMELVQPPDWPPPKGYANGVAIRGRTLFIAGQMGGDAAGNIVRRHLAALCAPALHPPRGGGRAAGGAPEDLAKMTVFVTDLDAYRSSLRAIGQAWKARLGKHFPAMALVGVAGLVEEGAVVEIEAVAVLEDP